MCIFVCTVINTFNWNSECHLFSQIVLFSSLHISPFTEGCMDWFHTPEYSGNGIREKMWGSQSFVGCGQFVSGSGSVATTSQGTPSLGAEREQAILSTECRGPLWRACRRVAQLYRSWWLYHWTVCSVWISRAPYHLVNRSLPQGHGL